MESAVTIGGGGAVRDARVRSLIASSQRARAELVAAIGVVDADLSYGADGHQSCRAWVRAVINGSAREASRLVGTARLFRDMPTVAAAYAAGCLGDSHVTVLLSLRANPRCRALLSEHDAFLADLAETLEFRHFELACERWKMLADPDGTHHDHEAAHARRRVSAGIVGGSFGLRAEGGNVDGARMIEILDHFAELEFREDWDDLVAEHGPDASPALLRRTGAQRRFDAFRRIFDVAEDAIGRMPSDDGRAGSAGRPVPTVNFVIDLATYEREIRRAAGLHVEPDDLTSVLSRRCETSTGVPVEPAEIIAAAMIGRARRIVVDAAGIALDVGRLRRFFTGPLREVVLALEPRCTWPGCGMPIHRLQVDHADPWELVGGETRPANANVLCDHHNRYKQRGHRTWRDAEGQWHTMRPDGSEITPRARSVSPVTEIADTERAGTSRAGPARAGSP